MWWLPLNAMCPSQGCADHGPVHVAPMRGVGGAQRGARSEYTGATGESSAFSWALKEFGLDKRWGKSVESEVNSIEKETVIGKTSEGSWGKLFWKPMISSYLRNCPFCLCPHSNPSPGTQLLHCLADVCRDQWWGSWVRSGGWWGLSIPFTHMLHFYNCPIGLGYSLLGYFSSIFFSLLFSFGGVCADILNSEILSLAVSSLLKPISGILHFCYIFYL